MASQLLQMRMQKAVISQNRLFREQQYQQRKERDIKEALEREAVRYDTSENYNISFCFHRSDQEMVNYWDCHFFTLDTQIKKEKLL